MSLPTFQRTFANDLAELGRVTEAAVAFLRQQGAADAAVYATNLALEEMATNVLKYGYDDTDAHTIDLCLEIHPERIILVLEDDGHEFNPLDAPDPDVTLAIEDRPMGGLGIRLVRQFTQRMEYERRDGRNRLTLWIKV